MDEKQPAAMNVSQPGSAGSPREAGRKPQLLPDGTHVYPVADVSIPAHGLNGGTGEITWHPERGLRFRVDREWELSPGGLRRAGV
jgi:hypothetical protein